MRPLSILALSALLAGCAGSWASNERDWKAKKFGRPHRDQSKIYVYREAGCNPVLAGLLLGVVGAAACTAPIKMQLFLDGVYLATTQRDSFVMVRVTPGPHTLVSRFQDQDASLTIDATGGWVYYVAQEAGAPGSVAGSELLLVDRETGREAILDLKMIELGPPPGARPQSPPPAPPRMSSDHR